MIIIPWREILFVVFILFSTIQVFYWLGFFRRVAFHRRTSKEKTQQHPVSVIICARDEAANLAKNLPGVLLQSYPTTHEVVVVNDNSIDESRYLLEGLHKEFRHLHVIELKQEAMHIPGKKFPLSIGIKSAKHEIMLLTDADCVPATENWIQSMQDHFTEGIEIVLGYGAYKKRPGVLNKLIRLETLHTAIQYLSYALAGMPYMGVGRNLAYKREVFIRQKGFSAHNHIPGGDDDLFINATAGGKNTAVALEKDAITFSESKKSFREWARQKSRHYSTAKYYKVQHRFLLGLYALSQFLFYPLLIASAIIYDWQVSLAVYAVRLLIQTLIIYRTSNRLEENDLWPWWWIFDIWLFFYYLIFAPSIWKKPRSNWN
jgi:glycosyltransferase involved in cell wall biosynthesis